MNQNRKTRELRKLNITISWSIWIDILQERDYTCISIWTPSNIRYLNQLNSDTLFFYLRLRI